MNPREHDAQQARMIVEAGIGRAEVGIQASDTPLNACGSRPLDRPPPTAP